MGYWGKVGALQVEPGSGGPKFRGAPRRWNSAEISPAVEGITKFHQQWNEKAFIGYLLDSARCLRSATSNIHIYIQLLPAAL
jgi:hypothetical protein